MIASASGIQRIIEHEAGTKLPPGDVGLLGLGLLLIAVALAALWRMRNDRRGAFEYRRLEADRTAAAA